MIYHTLRQNPTNNSIYGQIIKLGHANIILMPRVDNIAPGQSDHLHCLLNSCTDHYKILHGLIDLLEVVTYLRGHGYAD